MTPFDPLPSFSLRHLLEPFRLPGESFEDTAERILLGQEMPRAGWRQDKAAEALGLKVWTIQRKLALYGARKTDAA